MPSKGVALVTGAAQGIGRGIALRLARDGYDVVINDISSKSEQLQVLLEEIRKGGGGSSKHIADVSQEEQVKNMVEEVVRQHGSLDVMVANAGIMKPEITFLNMPIDQYDQIMNINAKGAFLCYKYAGLQMIKQGRGGRIIGASSLAGKRGIPLAASYTMSKFAVRGLTQAAALELGEHGITVNAYAPGAVDTPMMNAGFEREERLAQVKQMCALKTVGQPNDIASLVSFLASSEAGFITGQTISIDGGIHFD
ncbi:NAD-binding protein [Favolaschia claudopus]|uniref:NAD-binding protein n=1 Tax=Favolaschia claudopus TaxID=2862362 RepID=A0AAW0BAN6_9AGAR